MVQKPNHLLKENQSTVFQVRWRFYCLKSSSWNTWNNSDVYFSLIFQIWCSNKTDTNNRWKTACAAVAMAIDVMTILYIKCSITRWLALKLLFISSFISSWLDYCNFLLSSSPPSSTQNLHPFKTLLFNAVLENLKASLCSSSSGIWCPYIWLPINFNVIPGLTKLCSEKHAVQLSLRLHGQVLLTPVTYSFQSISLPWCLSWEKSQRLH